MKRVFFTLFVLLPTVALGQNGSQLGPLHLPFEFKITVNDSNRTCDESPYPPDSSFGFDLTIDPGDTNFHLNNDTIICSEAQNLQRNPQDSIYFRMVFDTTTETIQDLTLVESFRLVQFLGGTNLYSYLELINLSYDSTSIFSPDSDLNNHLSAASYSYYSEEPSGNPPPHCESLVYVMSVNLSGNFRPATLTEGVAMPTQEQSALSLVNDNGNEFCTFPIAAHPRTLQIYTPLGVKVCSVEVPAGAAQVALSVLTRGLYFVRMDGSILRVAIR